MLDNYGHTQRDRVALAASHHDRAMQRWQETRRRSHEPFENVPMTTDGHQFAIALAESLETLRKRDVTSVVLLVAGNDVEEYIADKQEQEIQK